MYGAGLAVVDAVRSTSAITSGGGGSRLITSGQCA